MCCDTWLELVRFVVVYVCGTTYVCEKLMKFVLFVRYVFSMMYVMIL
jgi:hypothetical protein